MNVKTVIPLVVALALGGVAAKLGKDMLGKRRSEAAVNTRAARVVVVRADIAPGTTLKDTDLALSNLPGEAVPPGMFTSTADLVGRVPLLPLAKGQPVFDSQLAARGAGGGAQAMIPDGWRAVTLEINEFSGVAGLLVPGCRVDILQTIRQKQDDQIMSRTIVENLKVLAVGRRMSAAPPANAGEPEQIARSVTLLATLEQAEIIDLATHMGNPRLVLRNGADERITGGKGITLAELRGKENIEVDPSAGKIFSSAPATRPVPSDSVPVTQDKTFRDIEIIRGGTVSSVKLPATQPTIVTGGADRLESTIP